MENVFEVPPTEASVPVKKPRKKRVMSEEQKKAFVARMRKSREEKKAKKANEASSPLKKTETSKEVVENIVKSPEAPTSKVAKNSPVKSEPRQPTIDYSHFNNLTSNIQLLNDTLMKLANPPPQPKQEPPPKPKQIVENNPPQHTKEKEKKSVEESTNQATASVSCPVPVPIPPKPEKRKVWNCRRKCYVYM